MIGSETGYNAFKLLVNSYDSDRKKWIEGFIYDLYKQKKV